MKSQHSSLSPHSLDTQSSLSRVLSPQSRVRRTSSDHTATPASLSHSLASPQASFLGMLGLKGDVLERMRAHQSRKEEEISPQLAARVLKAYILPLFEAETKTAGAQARKGYFCKGASPSEATIYGEIKLSIRLLEDLKASHHQISGLKRQLQEAKESAHSSSQELQHFQQQLTAARSHLTLLSAAHSQSLRTNQQLPGTEDHLRRLQEGWSQQEERARLYASLLQTERASSDKLKNHTVELEYSNALLRMQNELVGERLKGLYTSIESLSGTLAVETYAGVQLKEIVTAADQLNSRFQQFSTALNTSLLQQEDYRIDNKALADLRSEALEDRNRVTKAAKDHIQALQKRLHALEDDCVRLKQEAAYNEKRYRDLSEEFAKLRAKMKQYRQRRKAFGEAEERICRNCQRVFVDSENFNWSCRTHQSEFAEGVWWCCGRQGKEASGCRINKHESKEEDEAGETAQKEALAASLQRCPSCKDYGHPAAQCPKDPNYRSRFDLLEEAVRLEKITHFKHKQRLSAPDANLFKHKKREETESEGSEGHVEVEDKTPFAEIRKWRAGVAPISPTSSIFDDLSSAAESKLPSSPSYRLPRTAKSYQASPKASTLRRPPW